MAAMGTQESNLAQKSDVERRFCCWLLSKLTRIGKNQGWSPMNGCCLLLSLQESTAIVFEFSDKKHNGAASKIRNLRRKIIVSGFHEFPENG